MDLQKSVLWTDSTPVLKCIRNETFRFKIFVVNRDSQILKSSQSSQWIYIYINTTNNPGDVALRGLKVEAFLKITTCIASIPFVWQSEK